MKLQKSKEPLVQCRELRADVKIRSAAMKKVDDRVIGPLSRDIVAAEGMYHRSCYREYTRCVSSTTIVSDVPVHDVDGRNENSSNCFDEAQYETAKNEAYNELFCFIGNDCFQILRFYICLNSHQSSFLQ